MLTFKEIVLKSVPIVFMIGTFFVPNAFAEERFPFVGEISRGPVNVRAGANTNFESIDKLTKGDELLVVGRNYEWYKIRLSSTASVFIRADYIKVGDGEVGELIGDKVNVRAKPDSESSTLGQAHKGEQFKLVGKINDWWKISPSSEMVGFVHADFVKFKSSDKDQVAALSAAAPVVPMAISETPKPSAPKLVIIQGVLDPLVGASVAGDVHYQVLVDGKPAYLLKDIPDLKRFSLNTIHVEGVVAKEGSGSCPTLFIKHISLVL